MLSNGAILDDLGARFIGFKVKPRDDMSPREKLSPVTFMFATAAANSGVPCSLPNEDFPVKNYSS